MLSHCLVACGRPLLLVKINIGQCCNMHWSPFLICFNTIIADSMLYRLHVTCTEDLQGVATLTSADARHDAISFQCVLNLT